MNSTATKPVYQAIASSLIAHNNCVAFNNTIWRDKHEEAIENLVSDYLPRGSGIDNGVKFDLDASQPDRLVFSFGFHHMDETGSYVCWTDHTAIVTPSLAFGFDLRITGRDRNQIKDYLHETFHHALSHGIQE